MLVNIKKIETAPDYAKAFGIILVVVGHTLRGLMTSGVIPETNLWLSIDKSIYLFHMPLFFYISGLFFEQSIRRQGYYALIKKNCIYLLIPMIFWSYMQLTLQYLASGSVNTKLSLFDVLTAPFPPKQQFWFIYSLLLINIFVGALYKFRNTNVLLLLAFISMLVVIPLSNNIEPNFLITQVLYYLPFFILGIFLNTTKIEEVRCTSYNCVLMFFSAIAIFLLLPSLGGITSFLCSAACTLTIYKFMNNVSHRYENRNGLRIFGFIGMNSMIIYLAHVISEAGYRTALLRFGISDIPLHLVGGTIIGILIPLALVPLGVFFSSKGFRFVHFILPVRSGR